MFAGFEFFADKEECDLGRGGEGDEDRFSKFLAHNVSINCMTIYNV